MAKRANNEGTIFKKTVKKNGKTYTYWESQVTIGNDPGTGKRIRKTFTGKTQKEVKEKMQDASVAIQKQEYFEPSKATLGDWIDLWLAEYCSHIKYQTRKSYKTQCDTHIKPALGAVPLSALSTPQIQKFYNDLKKTGHVTKKKNPKTGKIEVTKKPLSPKSIKNIHAILSKCLNTAIELKYIKYNPSAQTKRPKVIKPEINPLENDQIGQFLKELDVEEYSDLFKVIIFTGLRKAEALGLSWNNVDFKNFVLRINQQLIQRPEKDGGYTIASVKQDRIRYITISQYVIDVLNHQKAAQAIQKEAAGKNWINFKTEDGKPANLIFTRDDGRPLSPKTVYNHYKKIAKLMDMAESRVHDLRHTYAVVSLQNGDDYKTLQENLGHASASFTLDVYGHRTTQMQKESASRMQGFISSLEGPNDSSENKEK